MIVIFAKHKRTLAQSKASLSINSTMIPIAIGMKIFGWFKNVLLPCRIPTKSFVKQGTAVNEKEAV